MISLSLPIRPRIEVRCEYLLTPLSVSIDQNSKRVLCISSLKSTEDDNLADTYTRVIETKTNKFAKVVKDSDPEFLKQAPKIITERIPIYTKKILVRTCKCGAYEELSVARMFDLRRVVGGKCVYCKSALYEEMQTSLLADIVWPQVSDFSHNRKWVAADLKHFLSRQPKQHKISKRAEPFRLAYDEVVFGIRYQVVWAALIVWISENESDKDLTLHYVHKVQDKAYFVASLIKMMAPDIRLHLKALPIVWLESSPPIDECRPSHVKLLAKSLTTKKKEIRVSLKSWRS